MKVKFLFFACFAISIQTIFGQAIKPIPTVEEWQTYFYARKKSIEKELYQLAIEGKIKAYKTDSLVSYYKPEEFKKKGSSDTINDYDSNYFFDEKNKMLMKKSDKGISRRREARVKLRKDSMVYLPFNPDNSLKDLWFLKSIKSSPFDEDERSSFKGIALTFQPTFQGYGFSFVSLCWFSTEDLKKVLRKEEFEWLKLIYYYASNDNTVLFRKFEQSYDDIYSEINNVKSAHEVYSCDVMMFGKISNSIHSSCFYINSYLRDEQSGIPYLPVLYDFQENKHISYNQFRANYSDEITVFIQTDSNNSDIGRDSIMKYPKELFAPCSIEIDSTNFELKTFYFETWKFYPGNGEANKFSIDANRIRKLNTVPTLFWFFEDYFRWKK